MERSCDRTTGGTARSALQHSASTTRVSEAGGRMIVERPETAQENPSVWEGYSSSTASLPPIHIGAFSSPSIATKRFVCDVWVLLTVCGPRLSGWMPPRNRPSDRHNDGTSLLDRGLQSAKSQPSSMSFNDRVINQAPGACPGFTPQLPCSCPHIAIPLHHNDPCTRS